MTYNPLRTPRYGTDDRGLPVVRVPLANLDAHAIVDVADYDTLLALGVSPNWSFDGRIVRVGFRPGNTRRVARLIMDPPDGNYQVRHRNRNALDLRRDNLFLKKINRQPKPDFGTARHKPL
ncbi:hypothetical protein ACQKLX_11495 [Bosea sp. NPDC003192]|uniref:hypothetical protein n=1 Tax=Bosea sp. NPDC003192 TaxID=3390551 RepID=UPI003D03FFD2